MPLSLSVRSSFPSYIWYPRVRFALSVRFWFLRDTGSIRLWRSSWSWRDSASSWCLFCRWFHLWSFPRLWSFSCKHWKLLLQTSLGWSALGLDLQEWAYFVQISFLSYWRPHLHSQPPRSTQPSIILSPRRIRQSRPGDTRVWIAHWFPALLWTRAGTFRDRWKLSSWRYKSYTGCSSAVSGAGRAQLVVASRSAGAPGKFGRPSGSISSSSAHPSSLCFCIVHRYIGSNRWPIVQALDWCTTENHQPLQIESYKTSNHWYPSQTSTRKHHHQHLQPSILRWRG